MSKHLVFTWGRFQPPHWDHHQLIDNCDSLAAAKHGNVLIFTSATQDKKKNPLTFEQKTFWLTKMFPYHSISGNANLRTIFDVIKHITKMHDGYYETFDLMVGSDRSDEFKKKVLPRIRKFIYEECPFNRDPNCFNVISSEHENNIHSSTLRDLVKLDQYLTFCHLYKCHTQLSNGDIHKLFYQIQEGMEYNNYEPSPNAC